MLSVLTAIKYLDLLMPRISGLTGFEFTFFAGLIIALLLRPIVSLFVFISAPFLWFALGQTSSIGILGMALDYSLPMLSMFLVSFSKKRLSFAFLASIVTIFKLFSHTLSGMFVYDFSFEASIITNLPFVAITCVSSLIITLIIFNKIISIRKLYLLQNGYLNVSYKVKVNKKPYQLRVPKRKLADWNNEKLVYKALFPDTEFLSKGKMLKPFIEGETIKQWDAEKLASLKKEIKKIHDVKIDGLIEHDWMSVSKHFKKLSVEQRVKYLSLVNEHKDLPKVTSHNDINKGNVLWDGKKVTIIDFEWARLNNEYFDYASFEIMEGINIFHNNDDPTYQDIKYITNVFFYLWTFDTKFSLKIYKLRNQYKNAL